MDLWGDFTKTVGDFWNYLFPSEKATPEEQWSPTDPFPNRTTEWLYDEDWDEQKFELYQILKRLPLTSWYIDDAENKQALLDYMKRYGLTWDDIKRVNRLPGANGVSAGFSGLNFVSDNLKRLYK